MDGVQRQSQTQRERLTIQFERRFLVADLNVPSNDRILLPNLSLEFNLDPTRRSTILDESRNLRLSTENLRTTMSAVDLCESGETRTEAGNPSPIAMAQAMVDFPVPFGPIIMLRSGPGKNSTEV